MWLRRVQACHFHLLLLVLMQKRVIVIKRMNELFILISKPHKGVICPSVRRARSWFNCPAQICIVVASRLMLLAHACNGCLSMTEPQ